MPGRRCSPSQRGRSKHAGRCSGAHGAPWTGVSVPGPLHNTPCLVSTEMRALGRCCSWQAWGGRGKGGCDSPTPVPAGAEPGLSPMAEAQLRRSDMPRVTQSKKRSPGRDNTDAWWILSSRTPLSPPFHLLSCAAAEPPPLPMKQGAAAHPGLGSGAPPLHTHQIAMCRWQCARLLVPSNTHGKPSPLARRPRA